MDPAAASCRPTRTARTISRCPSICFSGTSTTPLSSGSWKSCAGKYYVCNHLIQSFINVNVIDREQNLTDVSITCGDVSLEAHSLILSASSPILRSILAKGEGKKQTLHFMDMNPYHMQLLLQYMYKGEISVPQAELATLMTSARSLQIKGLCNTASPPAPPPASGVAGVAGGVATSSISVPNAPPHPIPITAHQNPGEPPQVSIAENNRLSEFANYLATQTQPLPPPAVATNGPLDLGQPHINHLLEVEPPQQPIVQAATKKRRNAQDGATGKKKRKSKKPFEDLRNGELQHTTTGSLVVVPDSSNGVVAAGTGNNVSMAVDGMHDDDHVTGNEVVNNGEAATSGAPTASGGGGSSSENWNEQQTMKVKVRTVLKSDEEPSFQCLFLDF